MSRNHHKKKSGRNYAAIIITTILLLLVTGAIAVIAYLMTQHRTISEAIGLDSSAPAAESAEVQPADTPDGNQAPAADGQTEEAQTEEEPAPEDIPEEERYYFPEGQLYSGDLILVNGDYPYHFEYGTNDIDLLTKEMADPVPMSSDKLRLSFHAASYLNTMLRDCNEALGVTNTGISEAFRTKEYQQNIWDEIEDAYGESYAESMVAIPGYSEHHTGLAVDLTIYRDGWEDTFSGSDNAAWLSENCYQYGFVRRYKEHKADITKINNESWHFRYVGVPHATYMEKKDLCLEEYIEELRQYTVSDPLVVQCATAEYHIWYTDVPYIREPEGVFSVSGNNIDGYIITEVMSG